MSSSKVLPEGLGAYVGRKVPMFKGVNFALGQKLRKYGVWADEKLSVSLLAISFAIGPVSLNAQEPAPEYDAMKEVGEQVERIKPYDDGEDGRNAVITYPYTAGFKACEMPDIGILRGRTVLVKGNIETEQFPARARSLALRHNFACRNCRLPPSRSAELPKPSFRRWPPAR